MGCGSAAPACQHVPCSGNTASAQRSPSLTPTRAISPPTSKPEPSTATSIFGSCAANLKRDVVPGPVGKARIVTGRKPAEICRNEFPAAVVWTMWIVSELAAMATDLVEFLTVWQRSCMETSVLPVGSSVRMRPLFGGGTTNAEIGFRQISSSTPAIEPIGWCGRLSSRSLRSFLCSPRSTGFPQTTSPGACATSWQASLFGQFFRHCSCPHSRAAV
jgi:hypothetical protein